MTSVADDLRAQTLARVCAMSIEARIALALALGDADAEAYARHAGLPHKQARARLRASRQHGRKPSIAAADR